MKATVEIRLKAGVLDPQGKAVEEALHGMGFRAANNVRVGKLIELEVEGESKASVEAGLEQMCEKLLANTVIESYRFDVQ